MIRRGFLAAIVGLLLVSKKKAEAASFVEALPSANATNISAAIHGSTAGTPVAADEMLYLDNTNSFSLKKLTLATLKSFILEGRVWNWAGQAGQPNWLWGSNDGINQYVWNPGAFNVDMVDGLHGANLVYGGVNKKSNSTGNMNDLAQKCGFYYGYSMAGAPGGDWYMYMNAYGDSWADAQTYGFQLANQFWSDQLWFRRVNNGAYLPWTKILSSANLSLSGTTLTITV